MIIILLQLYFHGSLFFFTFIFTFMSDPKYIYHSFSSLFLRKQKCFEQEFGYLQSIDHRIVVNIYLLRSDSIHLKMKISVQILLGKSITMDVDHSDTVYIVKSKLQDLEGMDVSCQRLIFNNQLLQNHCSLQDCGILSKNILYLYLVRRASTTREHHVLRSGEKEFDVGIDIQEPETGRFQISVTGNNRRFGPHDNTGVFDVWKWLGSPKESCSITLMSRVTLSWFLKVLMEILQNSNMSNMDGMSFIHLKICTFIHDVIIPL